MKKTAPIAFALTAAAVLLSPFLVFKVIERNEENEKEGRIEESNISNTPEARRIFETYFHKETKSPDTIFGYVDSGGNGEYVTYLKVNDSAWVQRVEEVIEKSPGDSFWISGTDIPQWFLSEKEMRAHDCFRYSYDGTNDAYVWIQPEEHSLHLLQFVP